MQISIDSSSFGGYVFSVNGTVMYREAITFSLGFKKKICAGNETKPLIILKRKSFLVVVRYSIDRYSDKSQLIFKVKSTLRHHFQCVDKNDTYDIYGHKIEVCSVYKNNVQVAWWDLKAGTGNEKIIANNDIDMELIISFYILANRLIFIRNDGQGILGNMLTNAFEERAFDTIWQPH